MRHGGGVIEKKWTFLVLANEFQRLPADEVRGEIVACKFCVAGGRVEIGFGGQFLMRGELGIVEHDPRVVRPQVCRVIIMRDGLAVVTVEAVEALLVRVTRAADGAKPPFSETAERIAELLEREGQLEFTGRHWLLSLLSAAESATVVTDVSVT